MSDNEEKIIREAMTRLLATREHSRQELLNKLLNRGMDAALCLSMLDEFAELGLQSDQRFAEVLVRSRAAKGYGQQRIRAELREHGIKDDLIGLAFDEQSIDWFELAKDVMQKKFGQAEANPDWKEQQKRNRFLQYRGFSFDQIRYANQFDKDD